MKVPPGMTEDEVLSALQNAANALTKFKFGPFDEDDMRQQAILFGLQLLDSGKYDPRPGPDGRPTRPLTNFLYSHMRNRTINFYRDRCRRSDPPCKSCHKSLPGQTEHEDRQYCSKYEAWLKRNMAKANLLSPLDITDHQARGLARENQEAEVETEEILRVIDIKLPASMRGDYLRLRDGQTLPKVRREEIENAVREIIKESLEC